MNKHAKPTSVSKTSSKRTVTFKKSPAKPSTKLETSLATAGKNYVGRMSTRTTPVKSQLQISTNEGYKQTADTIKSARRKQPEDHLSEELSVEGGQVSEAQ